MLVTLPVVCVCASLGDESQPLEDPDSQGPVWAIWVVEGVLWGGRSPRATAVPSPWVVMAVWPGQGLCLGWAMKGLPWELGTCVVSPDRQPIFYGSTFPPDT